MFQIAAHVDVVPLETALLLVRGSTRDADWAAWGGQGHRAGPFRGTSGPTFALPDRRDFSLPPHGATYLDRLRPAGVQVHALGKVTDIFTDRGVTSSARVTSN